MCPQNKAMGYGSFVRLVLAAVMIQIGPGEHSPSRSLLPVEVLGEDGTTATRTVTLSEAQCESVTGLWLQVHGVRYPGQASVQVNASPWMPLTNETVNIAEPGRAFGGIGGGFGSLTLTLPLVNGTVVPGANTVRFRFNYTDGLASGYRVLAWNFLNNEGGKVVPAIDFVEDAPEAWSSPLPDADSIQAGQKLWHAAPLVASSLPNSPHIQARCADCHAQDGRDLKYFNFSNSSIVARSRFHGLTTQEGEQIASYIRSLQVPNPGRPWNPPYQPGPGIDQRPVSSWAAGAGLGWVLDNDTDALPFLVGPNPKAAAPSYPARGASDLSSLVGKITPALFGPDGNLNPREIPIALQLPDWSQWLPRIHPKDAWGSDFAHSSFAIMYDGKTSGEKIKPKSSLRALLTAAETPDSNPRSVVPAFARWSQARRSFLRRAVKRRTEWSVELSNKVYSTQLWQLVKTWEMTQEFGLESRGRNLFGMTGESRTWCNTIPADTAPAAANIPDGPAGVGGSALTNEYLSASWYELQIVLNSGNHQHRDRTPIDWIYLISQFRDFYFQSSRPEPIRLLIAVTKAFQSTNPRFGPDNFSEGWRPELNIDPRIIISPEWMSIFKPLPFEVRRALTQSLLAAWMDKTLQYSIAKYLPLPVFQRDYSSHAYNDFTGGKVWEAAERFRAAGVSDDLVERLQNWGITYNDRAARLQYH